MLRGLGYDMGGGSDMEEDGPGNSAWQRAKQLAADAKARRN